MQVEEGRLQAGEQYRDFVVYGRVKPGWFVARLMEGSKSLDVTWTESLTSRRLLVWLQEVQRLAGGEDCITQIKGQASDDLRALIQAGKFDAQAAAQELERALRGRWRVLVTPRPNSETWDVTARRLGD